MSTSRTIHTDQAPQDVWKGKADTAPDEHQQGAVGTFDHFTAIPAMQRGRELMANLMQLRLGDRVLDAGCGIGIDTRGLANRVGDTGQVIGIDASAFMLEVARERSAEDPIQANFRLGDVEALAFDDETFDAACCNHTLEWVEHPDQVLAELIRVVKPDGRIVCKSLDWGTLVNGKGDPDLNDILTRAHLEHFPNPRQIRIMPKRFRDAGLEEISVHADLVFTDSEFLEKSDSRPINDVVSRLDGAMDAGLITEAQHQTMIAEAEAAHRTGTEYDSIVLMIVAGTKPGG